MCKCNSIILINRILFVLLLKLKLKFKIIPKITIQIERGNANELYSDYSYYPVKINVCCCEQCKSVKNMRKNRKYKNEMRRLLIKRTRKTKHDGKCYNHYYA